MSATLYAPATHSADAPPVARPGDGLDIPLAVTLLAVVFNISKVQEFVPHLDAVRPAGVLTALAFVLAMLPLHRGVPGRKRRWIDTVLLLGLGAVGLAAVPLSVWPGGALDSWRRFLLPNLLLFLAIKWTVDSERRFLWLIRAIALAVLLLVIGATVAPSMDLGRVSVGLTYDANDLGLLLATSLPFLIGLFGSARLPGRVFAVLLALGGIITLLRTQSRGALVGLIVAGVFMLARRMPRIHAWQKAVALGGGVLAAGAFISAEFLDRIHAVYTGADYNISGAGRLEIWKQGLVIASQHPGGVGMGQFGAAMGKLTAGRDWHTAHNALIQALVEIGPIGAAIFVAIIWAIWNNARRVRREVRGDAASANIALYMQCVQLAVIAYATSALFLSQAYFIFLPILLAATSGVRGSIGAAMRAAPLAPARALPRLYPPRGNVTGGGDRAAIASR